MWARVARLALQWVGWNALVLGLQYTASMLYLHACTSPPWVDVWRAITLAWSPSVGCLLLNQIQFFTQYIYLYNGAILVVAGLHELVRLVLTSYPVGGRRAWPLCELDTGLSPKTGGGAARTPMFTPRPKFRPRGPSSASRSARARS